MVKAWAILNMTKGALSLRPDFCKVDEMTPRELIANSPIAAVISDPKRPDNAIIECNQAFMDLTGYSRAEIVGRNCRFLRGKGSETALTDILRSAIKNQQPVMVEILNYKKDGSPFRNAVMVAPIFDANGDLEYFLGSQAEVKGGDTVSGEARHAAAAQRVASLSRRQRDVLALMAAGKLNKQIAYELGLGERTVKMHRAALLKNLDVRTNADAIRLAIEAGY
jgi:PAS domain S-box-containing protein